VGYLEKTLLRAQKGDVLELDEVWTFVGSKEHPVWLWLALCRRTRQIVAWWYGSRETFACRQLWKRIPKDYQRCFCYSDLLAAYEQVLPPEQHRACLKQEGQTNHIERFNLTLRQRVGRLVRKTLSFSKKTKPLVRAMRLFLIQYNRNKARAYLRKPR
jgi:IS1 family transposase